MKVLTAVYDGLSIYDGYISHPDADLTANAPGDIKALLDRIEELERRVNRE